jgi:hypothetical protein
VRGPRLERFSSRWSPGDSSKTQIPFGNDKQRELHLRGNRYKALGYLDAGTPIHHYLKPICGKGYLDAKTTIHCLAEGEVAAGLLDVAADLFAEGSRVGPADLGAEAAEEGQGQRGLLS